MYLAQITTLTSYCSYALPAQSGSVRAAKCTTQMGDPIGKLRMIHRQTSHDSTVMKDTGINETSYDSVALTKDTGVKRG